MKPLEYSHVYVIQSLRPGEIETGVSLFNDIIRVRLMQKNLESQCPLFVLDSRDLFFHAFDQIKQDTITKVANPIIHFEMHGNKQGLELTNGEVITWKELQPYLITINGICGNNLFITMATCHGGWIYSAINPRFTTPFWGFIGPFEEVYPDEVRDNYTAFYDEFLQSSDFNKSLVALHAANPGSISKFRIHNTEFVFGKAYINYELNYLTPEMVEKRTNSMVLQCKPLPEFKNWTVERIKDYGKYLIIDQNKNHKIRMMKHFFLLDKFPEHEKYYDLTN